MIDHLFKPTRCGGGTLGIIRCEGVWCTEVNGRPNETLEAGEHPSSAWSNVNNALKKLGRATRLSIEIHKPVSLDDEQLGPWGRGGGWQSTTIIDDSRLWLILYSERGLET